MDKKVKLFLAAVVCLSVLASGCVTSGKKTNSTVTPTLVEVIATVMPTSTLVEQNATITPTPTTPPEVAGTYPTTFVALSLDERKKLFDEFNALNGGDWAYENGGPNKTARFSQWGYISVNFPHPSGPNWRDNEDEEFTQIKLYILKNGKYFGLGENRLDSFTRYDFSSGVLLTFFQPSVASYQVVEGDYPFNPQNIQVNFYENEVSIRGNFYARIFIPVAQVKDAESLRHLLVGQHYSYTRGCGIPDCNSTTFNFTISTDELRTISIKKTKIVSIPSEDGKRLELRLIHTIQFASNFEAYVDATTGIIVPNANLQAPVP